MCQGNQREMHFRPYRMHVSTRVYNKWPQMNQSTHCFRIRIQNFMYQCLCASRKPEWANKFCSIDLQVQMTK